MFINTGIDTLIFLAMVIMADARCPGPRGRRGERNGNKASILRFNYFYSYDKND